MKKRMISALLLLALLAALLPTMALADNTAEAGSAQELQDLLDSKTPHITLTGDIALGENETLTIPYYTNKVTIDMAGHTISGGRLVVYNRKETILTGGGTIDCPAELNGTIHGDAMFRKKVTLVPDDECRIYGGSFYDEVITNDPNRSGSVEIHGGTFYDTVSTRTSYTTLVYGGVFHKDASFLPGGGQCQVFGGVFYKDVTVGGAACRVFAGIFFDKNLTAKFSDGTVNMNVIFDANGGTPETVTATAVAGKDASNTEYAAPIAPPKDEPTREGYVFTDWYTAPEGGELFVFDSKWSMDEVKEQKELTLYAHWEKAPEEPDVLPGLAAGALLLAGSDNPFRDVRAIDWFYGDVMYAYRRGLINGTAYDKFSPKDSFTRGMLLNILARHDGVKTAAGESWYESGCDWAVKNGISDGKNPTAPITREELAVILFRYAQYRGKQAMERADLSSYTDAGAVSDYAEQAMQWAVAQAIVRGDNYRLNPQGQTTRAEAAAMLHRFFPS